MVPTGDLQAFGRRDNDRRHRALRAARHDVKVEANQFIPRTHALTRLHCHLEASPFEMHRVDADVDQYLDATHAPNAYGMPTYGDRRHFAVAWRLDDPTHRIDCDPIAEHEAGEHSVRDLT